MPASPAGAHQASRSALRGLYAITPDALCGDPQTLLAAAAAALRGGAALLQYRDKRSAPAARLANARALRELCAKHAALLIVNDDAELAARAGADGVHLGAGDGSLDAARALLGRDAIIGITCGPSLDRARAAAAGGASYVALGRFFPSRTKPAAPPADLAVLRSARAELPLPICAIGGVTPANGGALIEAGADLLAAIDGLFGSNDPCEIEAAARAYARLFGAR